VTTTVARNSLFVICSLLLPIGPAAAASIWTVGGSASGASQYRQNNQPGGCSYNTGASGGCSYVNTSDFLPYNSSTNLPWSSVTDAYSATLQSSGDVNGLHALAAVSITNDPLDYSHYWQSDPGSGAAYATWSDTFTVNGPAPAYLVFDFGIDGALSATAHARADATVDWSAAVSSVQASSRSWTFSTLPQLGPGIPSSPLSAPTFLVNPGDSVSFSLRLGAKAFVGCQLFSNSTPFLCTASASADLSNTLSFASIGFQDPLGNYLPGYSISSTNFSYNPLNPLQNGGAVPEPGTTLLAGSTLLILAALARRAGTMMR
jgi:hypothetical protein